MTTFVPFIQSCSCWIAVGAGDKGAIWAFVVPMLLVILVRSVLYSFNQILWGILQFLVIF